MVNVCENNDKIEVHHIIPFFKNRKDHSDILIGLYYSAIHEEVLNLHFDEKFISNNYKDKNRLKSKLWDV